MGLLILAVITCVAMHLFSDNAGAQEPPQTPNCELTILDPDGQVRASFADISVPGDAVIPNSPLQPGESVTVILGDQCPEIGMTLYLHPDNTPVVAHPDSVVIAEDVPFTLPNGVSGIRLIVPQDFNPCAYQLDLYRGGQIDSFAGGARYGPRLIDSLNWYNWSENCLPSVTSTTAPTSTTSSVPNDTTTSTAPSTTTSSTVPDSTTTTDPDPTTSTSTVESTTTVVSDTSTSITPTSSLPEAGNVALNNTIPRPTEGVGNLPRTGSSTGNLVVAGIALVVAGGLILYRFRHAFDGGNI